DDVLGLRSDALLVHLMNTGTQRSGGGDYERPFLILWAFGPDGLVARIEQFDAERDGEALARFDELTGETPPPRLASPPTVEQRHRRVRANAATANAARIDAAIADRDLDALAGLVSDALDVVDQPTGTTIGRQGILFSFRAAFRARTLTYRHEPLATLGDSLL